MVSLCVYSLLKPLPVRTPKNNLTQVPTKRGTELAILVELRSQSETFLMPWDDMEGDSL